MCGRFPQMEECLYKIFTCSSKNLYDILKDIKILAFPKDILQTKQNVEILFTAQNTDSSVIHWSYYASN
jgi:hypothetical protein